MPKQDDLTTEQIERLAECLIQIKRLIFAPSNSYEERTAAQNTIKAVDEVRKVFE